MKEIQECSNIHLFSITKLELNIYWCSSCLAVRIQDGNEMRHRLCYYKTCSNERLWYVYMWVNGWSVRSIAQRAERSQTTVRRWLRRLVRKRQTMIFLPKSAKSVSLLSWLDWSEIHGLNPWEQDSQTFMKLKVSALIGCNTKISLSISFMFETNTYKLLRCLQKKSAVKIKMSQ